MKSAYWDRALSLVGHGGLVRKQSDGNWVEPLEGRRYFSLIGIQTLLEDPDINTGQFAGIDGGLNYDATTDLFSTDGTPTTFRLTPSSTPTLIQNPRDFKLNIIVNASGNTTGGIIGDDLLVVGSVDTN